MSKFLMLIQEKNKNKRSETRPKVWYKFFSNIKFLNILIIGTICFSGVLYLALINSMAIKGFAIKALDEKQATLKENIKKLEFRTAELQSAQTIQEKIANLDMVSVAKVDYATGTSAVAVK